MAVLYLSGHKSRGNDVKKVLESLGGEIPPGLRTENFSEEDLFYYINDRGFISIEDKSNIEEVKRIGLRSNPFQESYTLEEFESRWPYKLGDRVIVKGSLSGFPKGGVITKIMWMNNSIGYGLNILPDKLLSWDCLEKDNSDELIKEYSSNFCTGDCFVCWDNKTEILYLMRIKTINFKTGEAILSYVDVDTYNEEYVITDKDVKIDSLSDLISHLSMINEHYGCKKAENDRDFIKFISIKKELKELIESVKSSALSLYKEIEED